MELTTEDRQRIEQEAIGVAMRVSSEPWEIRRQKITFIAGAEYATIFERQQQAELRNKVIEEVLDILNESLETTNAETWQDYYIANVEKLKTK